MASKAFQRARGYGRLTRRGWTIDVLAVFAAAIVPPLLIALGLAIHLLGARNGDVAPVEDWALGPVIDGRFAPWPWFGSRDRCLVAVIALGAVLAVLESLAVWASGRAVHAWALRTCGKLKSEIRAQAIRLGPSELLSVRRSRPEELFSDAAETLRGGLVTWRLAIPRAVISLLLLIMLAMAVNAWLTLLAMVLAAVIWRFYARRRAQLEDEAHGWQQSADQSHRQLLETFRLAPLITGFGLPATPGERFETGLAEYERRAWQAHSTRSLLRPLLLLTILAAAALFLLAVGLRRDTSIAGSTVLITALICAYFPAWQLYRLRDRLDPAEQAADQIFAYLDQEPVIGQVGEAQPLERLQSEVRFENVTLSDRAGHTLLDETSFTLSAGQRVAIFAADAQTPIALAGLFPRFYDPTSGRVLFDGHDIARATLDTVRGQALFVTRDGPVFAGTVADNIACGDAGFTSLQIADVARKLGILESLQALPQGLSTLIGPEDLLLPPEQCFEIGLARAILREPSLLVLEEPDSDLEEPIAARLESTCQTACEGRTTIVLAARLATLRNADHVLLFHEGKLAAQGKHIDLLQTSELYRHLNYVRFTTFRNRV